MRPNKYQLETRHFLLIKFSDWSIFIFIWSINEIWSYGGVAIFAAVEKSVSCSEMMSIL